MFFTIFDFISYFSWAKDLSFDFLNIFWLFVFIMLQFLFVKFVSRQCSSIWEAHCAHTGDIPFEGFISSYSSFLQMLMPFPGFISVAFFKYTLSLGRRDRQTRTSTPRLCSGRVPRDGTELHPHRRQPSHCPTNGPMWHCPSIDPLPAHLPAKEPLLAHAKLTILRVTE